MLWKPSSYLRQTSRRPIMWAARYCSDRSVGTELTRRGTPIVATSACRHPPAARSPPRCTPRGMLTGVAAAALIVRLSEGGSMSPSMTCMFSGAGTAAGADERRLLSWLYLRDRRTTEYFWACAEDRTVACALHRMRSWQGRLWSMPAKDPLAKIKAEQVCSFGLTLRHIILDLYAQVSQYEDQVGRLANHC
jgi:hypothetical protein